MHAANNSASMISDNFIQYFHGFVEHRTECNRFFCTNMRCKAVCYKLLHVGVGWREIGGVLAWRDLRAKPIDTRLCGVCWLCWLLDIYCKKNNCLKNRQVGVERIL